MDLSDLNNAQTLGVLLVPPGARVLDIGAADGSVAVALKARGCAVTAIEIDPLAASAAEDRCERVILGDAELLDLEAAVGGERFDVVLLLDVLEHLREPGELLRHITGLLRPHGQIVASIPNVAHAAVRFALLQGRFTRTDVGLLDRTHLHFFDRAGVEALFAAARLHILDLLTVTKLATETEIAVDLSAVPDDTLRSVRADPDSEVYQFVLVARARIEPRGIAGGTLAGRLQARLRAIEREQRSLEDYARSLERAVKDRDDGIADRDRVVMAAQEAVAAANAARERVAAEYEQQVKATAGVEQSYRELEAYAKSLEEAIRVRELALAESRVNTAQARRDVAMKDAYISTLRDRVVELEGDEAAARQAAAAAADERDRIAVELERHVRSAAGLERSYRELETYARSVEEAARTREHALGEARLGAAQVRRDVAMKDAYISTLRDRVAELEGNEAVARHAAAAAADARDRVAVELERHVRSVADLERSYRELETYTKSVEEAARTREHALGEARLGVAQLRRELALKDAYLSTLRERVDRIEKVEAAAQVLPPRYWIADRVNLAVKHLPFVHGFLRAAFMRAFDATWRR